MLKKHILLSLLLMGGLLSTATHAASPALASQVDPGPARRTGAIYADLGLGYAAVDWHSALYAHSPELNNLFVYYKEGKRGGFIFGGNVGYQFDRSLSIEAGYYALPTLNVTHQVTTAHLPYLYTTSNIMYAAGKLSVPFLSKHFTVYGKLGVGVRSLRRTFLDEETKNISYTALIVGLGFQYYFKNNVSLSLQYLMMPSRFIDKVYEQIGSEGIETPDAHLLLASLGYRFNL